MDSILEPLMRSPKFPRLVDELNEARRREEIARAAFRAKLQDGVREEFINGEVIQHMTARDQHTTTVRNIARLMDVFAQVKECGAVRTEQALTAFSRNDYAPDICFWMRENADQFEPMTVIYPVPALICEVLSPSTESRDRGVKFDDYAAHGVAEYWIVDCGSRVLEQYFERGGQFELGGKLTTGRIASRAVSGFEMPVAAAFDEKVNLETLRSLLAI